MYDGLNWEEININIEFIKLCLMAIFTYHTYLKLTNVVEKKGTKHILHTLIIILISSVVIVIRYKINYLVSMLTLIFLLSLFCSKYRKSNLGYTILVFMISLGINYVLLSIGMIFAFLINVLFGTQNDYVNLMIMVFIQYILLYKLGRMKKIKNGISYLSSKTPNEYLDIIMLNISIVISFSFIIIVCEDWNAGVSRSLLLSFFIFAVIMFITIQKSIQLYYKQKLIIKDLRQTKSDLENAKQEIAILEKENIELSKKNHSFKHQYKSLKHKVDEIIAGNKVNEETDLNKELDNLSKDIYIAPKNTELSKTGIVEIDDMLNCMKSECDENNINFNLQIIGNIHYMINNLIPKEELEILLADHIKDAIIAINHSDNVNKSILVKLGKTEDFYGLYIYDSGIEFEKETLENLGKKPITTHSDEGGSGMGFMNTFDTLKKNNASLIINQIGKPSKDNFTKVLEFRFDGKSEFKILGAKE